LAGYVYILANRRNGATYTGVTNDIARRMQQHRERAGSAHAKKYDIYRLVYVEPHDDMPSAITREKRVKKWLRAWKTALIEKDNPTWRDLWFDLNR
jgi:putative endonuclease